MVSLLLALLLALGCAGQTQREVLSATCASDFSYLSRGTQTEGTPPYSYWRTGSPTTVTRATLLPELEPGAVVQSMSFSYQYLAGYGSGGLGSNISVSVSGVTVYLSPVLDLYNYSVPANHTGMKS